MKRLIIPIIIMTNIISSSFAQQSATDIAKLLKKYDNALVRYDDGYDTVYNAINQQIKTQTDPANVAVWHCCMAKLLSNYYDQNRWQIMDRTCVEGEPSVDFNTWDVQTLASQILFHYQKSLENEELLVAIPIQQYKPILDSLVSVEYRPTLYDFLAFQALDFLDETFAEMPVPTIPFDINNGKYWSDNAVFANMVISSPDEMSFSYWTLKIMQSLTKRHLKDQDARALIDVTLRRLNYLAAQSVMDGAREMKLKVLEQMEAKYQGKAGYEMIALALGDFYKARGNEYDESSKPEYKMDWATAMLWYQQAKEFATAQSVEYKKAKQAIEELNRPHYVISGKNTIVSQPTLLKVEYQNLDSVRIRVFAITEKQYVDFEDEQLMTAFRGKKAFFEEKLALPNDGDYRLKNGVYMMPKLPFGLYAIQIYSSKKELNTMQRIQVSNLQIESRQNANKKELFVVDRISGAPIANAKIELQAFDKNRKQKLMATDKDGKAFYTIDRNRDEYSMTIVHGNDRLIFPKRWEYVYHQSKDTFSKESVYFFTDRSIYRPGQTVYFKGILVQNKYNLNGDISKNVVVGKQGTVVLKNVNYETVGKVNYTTNEYGSFSGSFVLPTTGLTGRYSIAAGEGRHWISVEEYKRPTFEVEIEQPEKSFKIDQTVDVEGSVKAYAGYALDGAQVKYHVVRSASFPWWRCWWWMPSMPTQEIASGEVTTDADGRFHIEFLAASDLQNHRFKPLYNYEIAVDVTDITGETHSAASSVQISEIGLMLQTDIPEVITIEENKNAFKVEAVNLSGKLQKAKVHYCIEALEMPTTYRKEVESFQHYLSDSTEMKRTLSYLDFQRGNHPSAWKSLKTVAEGDFRAEGQPFSIPNMNAFKEGKYKLTFKAVDDQQNEIEEVCYVTIRQQASKKSVVYDPLWLTCVGGTQHEVGDTLQITVESYLKDARVLFEIISNNELVESRWVKIDQGKALFTYPLTKKDLGNLYVHAFTEQNGIPYERRINVTVPYTHQKIEFDFLTFRDKTLPGAKEEYMVRLVNHTGEKVAAELLCSMYDASLDALAAPISFNQVINNWHKSSYQYAFNPPYDEYNMSAHPRAYYRWSGPTTELLRRYPTLKFCSFERGFGMHSRILLSKCDGVVLNVVEDNLSVDYAVAEEVDEAKMVYEAAAPMRKENAATPSPEAAEKVEQGPSIRTNFNETAFFYPHLKTDENGDVLISFTMPESLTKWKLQGFAHNTDLMSGYFEQYVQTSKKLMVVPNAPRFLREGDTLVFSAKVVNMDTTPQCGNVTLQFRSALTDEVVPMITGASIQPFEVAPDKSQVVRFKVVVPNGVGAVTYRIVATNLETPAFSDGEEKTLPVLTNRMLVTESMPVYISGRGDKNYTFDKLNKQLNGTSASTTLQHHRLTLEFTPNPIWYAIQSLPYLMEYPYECNEQMFSRYYANVIAAHIVKSNPIIKEVFDRWLEESPEAFCSNLEKNEELKQLLLEETPWLMDAQRESANRQQVALLFDLQRMAREEKSTCQKLERRQNNDGGWSWFPDGKSSSYITEHIVAGFGHLQQMGIPTTISKSTLNKAVSFMDQEETDYYLKWIKGKKCNPSNLHYLYARSFYKNRSLTGNRLEAYNFFLNNAKKYWKEQSLYGQALTALVVYRNGDKELAKQIMNHIKSLAQYSEEMGMWWKKEGYGYFWYEAPVERQALFIEAFHEILNDQVSIEKMQLWLLKQKQTQNWETTRATTEACYALMLNQTRLVDENDVQLTLGDWHYPNDEVKAMAGSGYFKTSWAGDSIKPGMATLKIQKEDKGPAWGALYWQYFENLEKIEKNDDQNLSIRKGLYKVEISDRGEVLVPITEQTPLKVGDKVRVRVEIRADRDMEYVHLKDMRGSTFEPVNVLSGYKHQGGLWYYEATKDASTNFFIDYLPKGTYVFEYTLVATQAGTFSNGITNIRCMYAPEFTAHSAGIRVTVE